MSISRLIDSVVRCTICGQPPGCECWEECWCGWLFERGKEVCRRDHDAYIAGELLRCECSKPFDARKACGDARGLHNPCRCTCHRKDMRAGRERYEASAEKSALASPRLLNLLGTTTPVEPDPAPAPRRRGR